jgi:hypothetical protein
MIAQMSMIESAVVLIFIANSFQFSVVASDLVILEFDAVCC